jgi:putative ABC transport system permease protein
LTRVIVQQGVLLAFLGYVLGLGISWLMYVYVGQQAGIPMLMTWPRAVGVLLLANGICIVSGLLASRKLRVADPADLF